MSLPTRRGDTRSGDGAAAAGAGHEARRGAPRPAGTALGHGASVAQPAQAEATGHRAMTPSAAFDHLAKGNIGVVYAALRRGEESPASASDGSSGPLPPADTPQRAQDLALASAALLLGSLDEASDATDRCVGAAASRDVLYVRALLVRAAVAEQRGLHGAMLEALNDACDSDRDGDDAADVVAHVRAALALKAVALINMSDFKAGGAAIQRASAELMEPGKNRVGSSPEADHTVLACLAFAKRCAKDLSGAEEACNAASSIHARGWRAHYELALCHKASGRTPQSLQCLGDALSRFPGSPLILAAIAQASSVAQLHSAAASALRVALRALPGDATLTASLAVALTNLRQFERAVALLADMPTKRASAALPDAVVDNAAWALTVCASKLLQFERFEDAVKVADFVLARLPASAASGVAPASATDVASASQPRTNSDTFAIVQAIAGEALASLELRQEAEARFMAALDADDRNQASLLPLANLRKDQGRLDEAAELYERLLLADVVLGASPAALDRSKALVTAASTARSNPTHVFNLAQCYEYLFRYEEAVAVLTAHIDSVPHSAFTTMEHHATLLLLAKLLFAGPRPADWLPRVPGLLKRIADLPEEMVLALRASVGTHWAYTYMLRHLGLPQYPPRAPTASLGDAAGDVRTWRGDAPFGYALPLPPLFAVGDSHVLSFAWRRVIVRGEARIVVPRVVTGLKAWHARRGTQFLTHSNLHTAFASMPPGTAEVLFSAGEIDCREGIAPAVAKGKYPTLAAATMATVTAFVESVKWLGDKYDMTLLLMPVPPPVEPAKARAATCVAMFNDALRVSVRDTSGRAAMLDYAAALYAEEDSEDAAGADASGSGGADDGDHGAGSALSADAGVSIDVHLAEGAFPFSSDDARSCVRRRLQRRLSCDHVHLSADALPLLQAQLDKVCT